MSANVTPAPVSVAWDSAPVRQQFGDCRVVFDGVATVGAKRYRVNVSATRGARKPEIMLRHVGGAKGGQALPESQLIDVRDIIILAATLHLKPMRDAIVAACREGRESEIVSDTSLGAETLAKADSQGALVIMAYDAGPVIFADDAAAFRHWIDAPETDKPVFWSRPSVYAPFTISELPHSKATAETWAAPAPVRLRQLRGPDGQSILTAAPVDPAPALGEIGIASIRRALTLAHGALSPANNSEERQALAALDMALALPAIRQGASA